MTGNKLEPLYPDDEADRWHCRSPVEVSDHQKCYFFGHVSYFDHAPPNGGQIPAKIAGAHGGGVQIEYHSTRLGSTLFPV